MRSTPEPPSPDRDEPAATFRHAAAIRAGTYAPLYSRLWQTTADTPELLQLAAATRPGISPPDLFLAAIHYLLAQHPSHPLAEHYPTLTPTPTGTDPTSAFLHFCGDHRAELAEMLATRTVQTNEVRRCTFLRPAVDVAAAGRPVALIEPGASAGLNLWMDSYTYHYGEAANHKNTAGLTLTCELRGGQPPSTPLEVGWRAGVDLHPLDLADRDDVDWLRACVWADHPDRLARLNRAIDIAATQKYPAVMVAGDGAERLPELIAAAPPSLEVVVFHSAFLAHLTTTDRARFEQLVPALSRTRPIHWVQAEPQPDPAAARLRLRVCRNGQVIADNPLGGYHPHGEWLEWTAGVDGQPTGMPSSR